ncbi:MAG: hypothetical protein ACK5IQ_11560 [Bacteroidales bacterium]
MKLILSLLGIYILVSCSGNKSGGANKDGANTQDGNENKMIVDSKYTASSEQKQQYTDLRIYELELYLKDEIKEEYSPFISLTDGFIFSDSPDSVIIDKKYFGDNEFDDYHRLDSEHRKRFLAQLGVSEDDKVFVYNYMIDSLFSYTVKELPVIARANDDSYNTPATQYDYLVGFDLNEKYSVSDVDAAIENFVYIGKENPFAIGKLKPFVWKAADKLPEPIADKFDKADYQDESKVYSAEADDNIFFYAPMTGKFFVVDKAWENVLYQTVFYQNDDAGLTPLNYTNEDFPDEVYQWTGVLFKGKPPVIFGFEFLTSGCGEIRFLDKEKTYIRILCDNRG